MAMARRFWGAKLTGDEGVDLPYNFAIWMRKVGELARFKRGSLRYNSNHGTRLSWGAGLNSARSEQAPSRYNSKLGYNSIFSVF